MSVAASPGTDLASSAAARIVELSPHTALGESH
jgi:hypothetical protein